MANAEFEQCLAALMNPDNNVRGQAEQALQQFKATPDNLVNNLLAVVRCTADEAIRSMGAVMFRKTVNKEMWGLLTPDLRQRIRTEILNAVEAETSPHIRKKVADAVGEVATFVLEGGNQNEWPEFLPFLFRCAKSSTVGHRESAFEIFGALAYSIMDLLTPHLVMLRDLLADGLQDPASLQVRVTCVRATASVVQMLDKQNRNNFADLVPLFLQVLSAAMAAHDDDGSQGVLEELIGMAENYGQFFRKHLAAVLEAMFATAKSKDVDDSLRQLAMECLVTLAENHPGMVRKIPSFTQNVLPLAMEMMLEVEDDAEWYEHNAQQSDDTEYATADVGEEALDRLAIALGGKTVLPVAFQVIPTYLQNQDWRYRHTGLMTMSQIGEGCMKQMESQLGAIIDMILQHFMDPHPRVRYAAINAMGQLSTDFGPDLQKAYHAKVVPALVTVMDDAGTPRVQAHSAAAVINFTENCSKEILQPYLDGLVSKLLALLQGGKRIVQEQAITAIASVADCSEVYFTPYYESTMPLVTQILTMATGKDDRMLRGKAVECISIIAVAVGVEKFGPDAKPVMEGMMQMQSVEMDSDDPQVSYLLQAWGRIAKCLGQGFIPYLPYVMPSLLKSAALKPEIKITDLGDDDDDDDEDGGNTESCVVGDKRVTIHTSALEEKSTACNMLCCYASELKEGFFPYVQQVAELLVPLLQFVYNEDVRSSAAQCMSELVECTVAAAKSGVCEQSVPVALVHYIYPALVSAVKDEPDIDLIVEMCQAIHGILNPATKFAGEGNVITVDMINEGIATLITMIEESCGRTVERDQNKDEDYDEETEEMVNEAQAKEEEILDEVAGCVGAFVKTNPAHFMASGTQLLTHFFGLLDDKHSASQHRIALCVFDDVIESGKQLAAPSIPVVMPYYLKFAYNQEESDLRQAAVYGLGACAASGGEVFHQHVMPAVAALVACIQKADAREPGNIMATENAVSALGKIIEYQAAILGDNIGAAVDVYLGGLPVRNDTLEAVVVHNQLCNFVKSSNAAVLGANFKNFPKIICVLADVLNTDLVESNEAVVALLQQMRSQLPDAFNAAWAQMSADTQQKVSTTLPAQ